MVSCKDKIVIIPLFSTCYPQNLARNLARFLFSSERRFILDQDNDFGGQFTPAWSGQGDWLFHLIRDWPVRSEVLFAIK